MNEKLTKILVEKINKSVWWHVQPRDPDAYSKRGKFLSSTFEHAMFYGRPYDEPDKVSVENPLVGGEVEIIDTLFGEGEGKRMIGKINVDSKDFYEKRTDLDAKMFRRAKKLGYDSIVLLGDAGWNSLRRNRKPSSIELNLLYPDTQVLNRVPVTV